MELISVSKLTKFFSNFCWYLKYKGFNLLYQIYADVAIIIGINNVKKKYFIKTRFLFFIPCNCVLCSDAFFVIKLYSKKPKLKKKLIFQLRATDEFSDARVSRNNLWGERIAEVDKTEKSPCLSSYIFRFLRVWILVICWHCRL